MELKTLSITNFGKFTNKTINLSRGLNVIEGLNETGKTTIHAFIEAILYGFYDRNVKVRRLLKAYERYQPTQGVYGGSITLLLNKTLYRIERDLSNGLDQKVRVYNEKTGEDLTPSLDVDPVLKTVDMETFLDMPYRLYQNTLSIKQMASETSKDAESDLYSKIKNLLSSKNDLLRPHLAIEKLKKEKDAIGTASKTSKKPYALNLQMIETLKAEKKETLEIHSTVLSEKESLEAYKLSRKEKETALNDIEGKIDRIDNTLNKARYNQVKTLREKREALESDLTALKDYKAFDETDLEQARNIEQKTLILNEKIKDSQTTITAKESELTAIKKDIHPDVATFEALDSDKTILYKAYRETNDHLINDLTTQIAEKETTLTPIKEKLVKQKAVVKKRLKKWFLIIPLLLVVINKIKIKKLEKQHTPLMNELATLNTRLAEASKPKTIYLDVLEKYNQPSIDAFDAYYKTLEKSHHLNNQAQTLSAELSEHRKDLNAKKSTLEDEKNTLTTLYNTYNVKTLDDLITYQKKHQSYQNVQKDITHLSNEINALLNHQTFETLKGRIDFDQGDVSTDDLDTYKSTKHALLTEIKTLDQSINDLDKKIETTLATCRDIETIDFEMEHALTNVEKYKEKLKQLNQAITFIEDAKASIEENFAPILSDTIASYVKTLTMNTYETIKVSKTLDFKVIDPKTGHLKPPLHFSSGTKDQLYLAMRLGILKTLNYNHYPLFFDDVFVTYDEPRLKSALELLTTLSKKRQIVIFTCHTRERAYLKDVSDASIITL